MTYSNGDTYDGDFSHGLRDGWGMHSLISSGEVYSGYQSQGKRCKLGRVQYQDGHTYDGGWLNDEIHGQGLETWPDGEEYSGSYQYGFKHGKGVYKYSSGHIYDGEFLSDTKHGIGTCKWPNGDIYHGEYKYGARHGKGTYISAAGWMYEGDWRQDMEHGYGKQSYIRSGRIISDGKWNKGKFCCARHKR